MADEGASPGELILEACRRNNTELLCEVLSSITTSGTSLVPLPNGKASSKKPPSCSPQNRDSVVAAFLNNIRDPLGNYCLHVATLSGSLDVIDVLLDQPGLEVDPVIPSSSQVAPVGSTPLHCAVLYSNKLPAERWDSEGKPIVEILLDAGCDPRIRNRSKVRAVDLVDPRNKSLRELLMRSEMAVVEGGDVMNDDEDEGGDGPASDSD